ncbi:MAG: glycosyltransferase [Myxococcaceae bacterium]|nr:glycosyltransferase [Myxococcaceae bacterium]
MRVALVHDWLISDRGGEKVLDALCELFPDAEIFTLLHKPGSVPPRIEAHRIHTSFLQRVPGIFDRHRHFLPLFPAAIERFELPRDLDVVISSSHCVAKGVRVPKGARHLSYVHAPMRYMWDLFDDYFAPGRASPAVRFAATVARPALQAWDRQSALGVDRFVANSHHIARKIAKVYGRTASVVHPPVDLDRFTTLPIEGSGQGGYFLWVGALAPYKRIDLALEAFRRFDAPLWIAGGGQEARRLRGPLPKNVRWLGRVSDDELPALYRDARALIFPGEEDFGITPLEAQAAGRPVVAYGRGGALETVTHETGVFFEPQSADALLDALRSFDAFEARFSPAKARANAQRFSRERFLREISAQVEAVLSQGAVASR